MKQPQSAVLKLTHEQLWNWAFWSSIIACEVVGLLLAHRV
jgi:hypothetical protein